jgi:heme-degrading monooxygenase HmoA
MSIMREWRAEIHRALKDEYVAYVNSTGMVEYRQTPGNLGAVIATCDLDAQRTEIVTLSWWKDEESIKAFAGSDISRAHYYPEDDRFLRTRPETVRHYNCVDKAFDFPRRRLRGANLKLMSRQQQAGFCVRDSVDEADAT